MNRCADLIPQIHDRIALELRAIRERGGQPLSLLDVGCWRGEATARYRDILGGPAYGVEVFADKAAEARTRGIEVAEVDLEMAQFPWADATIDVVVCNQVFEHLKNIFRPMAEISRVLKPGGYFVFSVPNLAALHNRVLFAIGRQPTPIRTFGPHVRGFTVGQAQAFLTYGGVFAVERVVGIGSWRYGLPMAVANLLPSIAHTPIFVASKQEGRPARWLSHLTDTQSWGGQTSFDRRLQADTIA